MTANTDVDRTSHGVHPKLLQSVVGILNFLLLGWSDTTVRTVGSSLSFSLGSGLGLPVVLVSLGLHVVFLSLSCNRFLFCQVLFFLHLDRIFFSLSSTRLGLKLDIFSFVLIKILLSLSSSRFGSPLLLFIL